MATDAEVTLNAIHLVQNWVNWLAIIVPASTASISWHSKFSAYHAPVPGPVAQCTTHAAVDEAKAAGFQRINLDLMYALHSKTLPLLLLISNGQSPTMLTILAITS